MEALCAPGPVDRGFSQLRKLVPPGRRGEGGALAAAREGVSSGRKKENLIGGKWERREYFCFFFARV